MEWFYAKRRGPEWKQGWSGQTLASMSTPPLPLLTILGIVIVLLWFSQYTDYKSQLHHTVINFQLFFFLFPVLLIFFMAAYSTNWLLNYRLQRSHLGHGNRAGGSATPWGIAIFAVVLLVLLSYQSSFHSKWFGPLWRSN